MRILLLFFLFLPNLIWADQSYEKGKRLIEKLNRDTPENFRFEKDNGYTYVWGKLGPYYFDYGGSFNKRKYPEIVGSTGINDIFDLEIGYEKIYYSGWGHGDRKNMKKFKTMLNIDDALEDEVQRKIDILTEKVCKKVGYRIAFAYMHDSNRILKQLGFKRARFVEICNNRKIIQVNDTNEIKNNNIAKVTKPTSNKDVEKKIQKTPEQTIIQKSVNLPKTYSGCTNITNTRFPIFSSC